MQILLEDFKFDPSRKNITIFVLYNYSETTIMIESKKDATDASMIQAFSKQVSYLKEKYFKPVFNIIDNVVSKTIRTFFEKRR